MNTNASSAPSGTPAWTELWLDAQRQYWNTWLDLSRRIAESASPDTDTGPADLWKRTLELWFGAPRAAQEEGGESPADPLRQWMQVWTEAQRNWWKLWLESVPRTAGAEAGREETADNATWTRVQELWTQWLTPLMPTQARDWVSRWLDANRGFLHLADSLWGTLAATQAAAERTRHPWDALRQDFRDRLVEFGEQLRTGKDPWSGLATLWGIPLDNWRRVCSAFSVLPGDMEKAARGPGSAYGPESLHRGMVGFLSMPTVGYTREWQEELQRWSLLWLDHQQALQEYGTVLVEIHLRSVELFGAALQNRLKDHDPPDSLRALYNLWIDSCEEAYGQIAVSPPFISAQTRLTNTLFALKKQEQKMVEELQSALNMPTRRELDTSHRRLHQLHRRVWEAERALERADASGLREELSALRGEVETLRQALEGATQAVPAKDDAQTGT